MARVSKDDQESVSEYPIVQITEPEFDCSLSECMGDGLIRVLDDRPLGAWQ
jgi:hypothetical protein